MRTDKSQVLGVSVQSAQIAMRKSIEQAKHHALCKQWSVLLSVDSPITHRIMYSLPVRTW
jgi:hypothetical protein